MAFNFGFFGTQEHKVFNYRPRYYDPKKEELRRKFGDVDGTNASKKENYVPGAYIKGSLKGGEYKKTKVVGKNQSIIGAVSLLLFFVALMLFARYFSMLLN